MARSEMLWACLTCKRCSLRCPSGVDYASFIRDLRAAVYEYGVEGNYAHCGILQNVMRMMAEPDLEQNRLEWVDDDCEIAEDGEIMYFVGCAPHFDAYFDYLDVDVTGISNSAIKVLNNVGIKPVLLKDERCCGHDLLYSGDVESFKRLAKLNIETIKKHNIKKVVFSCPEGYKTFKQDYPEHFGALPFEVVHLTEVMADFQDIIAVRSEEQDKTVTFHDPCRLGRHMEIYDAPRVVLNALPGVKVKEMLHSREAATCCGTCNWMNCGQYSRQIQNEKLAEAEAVDADVLVTACPKCYIHLSCAMDSNNGKNKIVIKDLATMVNEAMKKAPQTAKASK